MKNKSLVAKARGSLNMCSAAARICTSCAMLTVAMSQAILPVVMSTNPHGITTEVLIGGGYCKDAADCDHFRQQWGCNGHYSWDVTFRRAY